ncbi:MAG: DUF5103 domain-containing protein [Flavobacteriales bacterium]|nr:DUF5103 domain-containing protein [Flavobacteriales bacterium]
MWSGATMRAFTDILRVPGAINSQSTLHYAAVDEQPLSGTSYYRLRQTDVDGTSTVSNVVTVVRGGQHGQPITVVSNDGSALVYHGMAAGSEYIVFDAAGGWFCREAPRKKGRSLLTCHACPLVRTPSGCGTVPTKALVGSCAERVRTGSSTAFRSYFGAMTAVRSLFVVFASCTIGLLACSVTAPVASTPEVPDYYDPQADIRYEDRGYSPTIHTVKLYKTGFELSVPVIQLGSGETMELHFDDLSPDPENLNWTIVHCDPEWKPSDLSQGQYLDGAFSDFIPPRSPELQYTSALSALCGGSPELPDQATHQRQLHPESVPQRR